MTTQDQRRGDEGAAVTVLEELALRAEVARLRAVLGAILDTFQAALANFDARGRGGQHVTYLGEFASQRPSEVAAMRRWSRAIGEALEERS